MVYITLFNVWPSKHANWNWYFTWSPAHTATLQRSLVALLRYRSLRCRDLWFRCDVTIKCHTGRIDAACTSCKQFIPNSLGARHKDVMLYAKMWQWRFINKCKKLLEKTPQMLRKIEWKRCLHLSNRNRQENHVLLWRKHHLPKKHPNLEVQISHFSSDNNGCLAEAKHHFFCKTLFSRARFSVRRDV